MSNLRKRRTHADDTVDEAGINAIVDVVVANERASGKPSFANVLPGSVTPYSDATSAQAGSRTGRIKRPLNTFMVFAHLMRSKMSEMSDRLNHAIVSKRLGEHWQTFSSAERQPFIEEANRLKELHTKQYPNYRYQPRRRFRNSDSEGDKDEPIGPRNAASTSATVESSRSRKAAKRIRSPSNSNIDTQYIDDSSQSSDTNTKQQQCANHGGKMRLKQRAEPDKEPLTLCVGASTLDWRAAAPSVPHLLKTNAESDIESDSEFLGQVIVSDVLSDSELADYR